MFGSPRDAAENTTAARDTGTAMESAVLANPTFRRSRACVQTGGRNLIYEARFHLQDTSWNEVLTSRTLVISSWVCSSVHVDVRGSTVAVHGLADWHRGSISVRCIDDEFVMESDMMKK